MPQSYLWGVDENGDIFSLSSWNNYWQKVESFDSKVNKFKTVASSLWCIWSVGIDNQVYIFVPYSEIKIRTADTIIENQRRDFSRYNGRNLKTQDPPEYAAMNYYGKLIKSDLKSFPLPSTRWNWENSWKIVKSFNGELTEEGWIYSSSFMQKFQNHPNRFSNFVRRRYWQRYRYFNASERWLLIEQDSTPFEITCNQDSCLDLGFFDECVDYFNSGIVSIGCGGEMLPHQKDGFVSVWTVNENGQVLYRLDVHRQNPEGSHWCLVKLPKYQKATHLSVGPLGHLLVYCSQGTIYFRDNVTWKNPIGSSWSSVNPPEDLIEGEKIAQLSMSVYAIWIRSTDNRVWFKKNVNLHVLNPCNAIGNVWILMAYNISWICSSPSGQLWGLPINGNGILYRLSSTKLNKIDRFWSGYMQCGLGFGEQDKLTRLKQVCAHGLFVEDDVIPSAWLQSPVDSRLSYSRPSTDGDWKNKIIDCLVIRDYEEFKNPAFSSFISLSEQVSWSKATDCQAQSLINRSRCFRWMPANVVLHHKLKDGKTIATLHVNITGMRGSRPDIVSFIESEEIISVSKYSPASQGCPVDTCTTLVAFIRQKGYRPTQKVGQEMYNRRLLLKFSSENEVEDWILWLNFVMRTDERNLTIKADISKIWILNQLYEPFYGDYNENEGGLMRGYQSGGHFKMIESCAKGRIAWALGFNGISWVSTNGWGGSYLGSICSSKDNLGMTADEKSVAVIEIEKLKMKPGQAFGKFTKNRFTDAYGNIIRGKDCVQLPSKRFQWSGSWSIDHSGDAGQCDMEGWQYSTSLNQRFDSNLTWNKNFRRRRWIRNYKTSMSGPWIEVGNESVKVADVSLSTEIYGGVSDRCLVWALSDTGLLLRRRGVTVGCPQGIEWIHVRTSVRLVSVSVNRACDLWVICTQGVVRRLRYALNRTVTQVNDSDWEVARHPEVDGKFSKVSSGDRYSAWAIDQQHRLWTRVFTNMTSPSIGDHWVYVCDHVLHVSCSAQHRLFVVFTSGSVAERLGISTKLPQGSDWRSGLDDIATYVSIRGS